MTGVVKNFCYDHILHYTLQLWWNTKKYFPRKPMLFSTPMEDSCPTPIDNKNSYIYFDNLF